MTERAITFANDETLLRLISKAQRRVVALAPAFSERVAGALCERWQALGANAVQVIVDPTPEVYRLGYGDFVAVKTLESVAAKLGGMLQRQPGIRIGLLISDDTTLVYSPTAQLIEAGPSIPQTPNAILLDTPPPQVERELGAGANGVCDQIIGQDKATLSELTKVEAELKENPPQKFNVARTMRVFNSYLEFVEFHLTGTYIHRKIVQLPEVLMGVADKEMRKQLRASFRIVPNTSEISGEALANDRNLLAQKYLHVLPKFGTVIKRARKVEFEKDVELLKQSVEKFKLKVREVLQAKMNENQHALCEALFPGLRKNCPRDWIPSHGTPPDDATLRQLLERCLKKSFGSVDKLITDMRVVILFKAVTHEMLIDAEFVTAARERIPGLAKFHTEFDAARGEPQLEPLDPLGAPQT